MHRTLAVAVRVLTVLALSAITALIAGLLAGAVYIALSGGHYEREPAMTAFLVAILSLLVTLPLYAYVFFRRRQQSH
ncbi:MAG: hypothetical protein WAM82_00985 [Thermoanaerobaculia bacterium]